MANQQSVDEGLRIVIARRLLDIKQAQLARDIGASCSTTVWRWESGEGRPSDAFLEKLAARLGVTAAWLRFGAGAPPRGFAKELEAFRSEQEAKAS